MRAPLSPSGNPLTTFVNLWQTKEERQLKYWLCRSIGLSPEVSRRMRDWHLTKVEQYIDIFYSGKQCHFPGLVIPLTLKEKLQRYSTL